MDNTNDNRSGSYIAASGYGDSSSLPCSIEAEQAVLGAILVDSDCLNSVLEQLKPECFFSEHHREIFSAMHRLFRAGTPVDFVTVLSELVGVGVFSEDYGKRYLMALAETVPSLSSVTAYCKIIRDKYQLRALIMAARDIIADASDESNDAGNVLDRAEQRIYEIANNRSSQGMRPLSEVILEAYEKLMLMEGDMRDDFVGIPSGISTLDNTISGLCKTDLIILAARPSVGKTAFALNIARNVAVQQKKPVAFFSLEMTCEQLALRILSTESGVEGKHLRDGRLNTDEWTALSDAANRLHGAPIYLEERSDISITEMKAKLRRMGEVGLVIIDYLQLMKGKGSASREQDVSDLSRNLKIMAKELNVPIICLSQLNRMVEGRKDHKPMLSDLRESGSIEQDADIVLMLYREDYYAGNDGQETPAQNVQYGKAICVVAKNRHGERLDIELNWSPETTQFTAIETRH